MFKNGMTLLKKPPNILYKYDEFPLVAYSIT